MKIDCPECGGPTLSTTITGTMPEVWEVVEIEIIYCTICDWMTVTDWQRPSRAKFPTVGNMKTEEE